MNLLPKNAALLLIDVQKGFADPSWGERNNPDAEERMADLLAYWRETKRPVIHVQHMSENPNSPLHPDGSGNEIQDLVKPIEGEPLFQKKVNSAFIGTDLQDYLMEHEIATLVIVGLTTDHCVSTTTRMAGNFGFDTYVVEDATATFDKIGHDGRHYEADVLHTISLASLHNEFAKVVKAKDLLSEQ